MSSDPEPPARAVRLRIHGRVQGVGFRWWTRDRARDLGITGAVRNNSDGTVEIEAFGPRTALDVFRRAVADGPPAAQVSRVEEHPLPIRTSPSGFVITD